jgi:hypothetical protein
VGFPRHLSTDNGPGYFAVAFAASMASANSRSSGPRMILGLHAVPLHVLVIRSSRVLHFMDGAFNGFVNVVEVVPIEHL